MTCSSIPKSWHRCVTSLSSSSNVPSSSSSSIRSRAESFPSLCWRLRRSAPPPCSAASWRRRSSPSLSIPMIVSSARARPSQSPARDRLTTSPAPCQLRFMPEVLSSQDVVRWTRELNYGTWRYQKSWNPLHVVDAEGCYFIDVEGKRYLDFSAQLMCVNLGHKNPAVIRAIQEQAAALPYIAPGYATDVRVELSRLLLDVLPRGLSKFFFTTS